MRDRPANNRMRLLPQLKLRHEPMLLRNLRHRVELRRERYQSVLRQIDRPMQDGFRNGNNKHMREPVGCASGAGPDLIRNLRRLDFQSQPVSACAEDIRRRRRIRVQQHRRRRSVEFSILRETHRTGGGPGLGICVRSLLRQQQTPVSRRGFRGTVGLLQRAGRGLRPDGVQPVRVRVFFVSERDTKNLYSLKTASCANSPIIAKPDWHSPLIPTIA